MRNSSEVPLLRGILCLGFRGLGVCINLENRKALLTCLGVAGMDVRKDAQHKRKADGRVLGSSSCRMI